jgi:hypothetical protein
MNYSSLTVCSVFLLLGSWLPAQSWLETADAGDRLATAQVPQGVGPLTSISGALAQDADLYLLQIDDPVLFSASTVGGASFDTQLFLFDQHGRGITMRDDVAGSNGSTLTGQFVPTRGRYYLAVSAYDRDPLGGGGELWNDTPFTSERQPDGPRQHELLMGWSGGGATGSYTLALTGVSFPAPRLVLPDTHHLTEDPAQQAALGSSSFWQAGGGRFQLLYEASHFLGAGVNGPIALRRLTFRGEDGQPDVGGAFWSGATVQVGATSLTAATMNASFAVNRNSASTTLGPAGLTSVTIRPSVGSTPNNDNIVIDLTTIGAGFAYDPTGARPNLLVDVTLPGAALVPPTASPVMPMQDTSGGAAVVRGRGLSAGSSAAATGTLVGSPLVMAVEYSDGGDAVAVTPARNELFGAACGGAPSAFYQAFLHGQPFDLRGLRLVPNDAATPVSYQVSAATTAVDESQLDPAPDSVADDAVVAHGLGFTFRYPGGSTSAIRVCTNGFLWLDGTSTSFDVSPTVAELLGAGGPAPRRCPRWYDFHCGRNTTTHPGSGLHVRSDLSGGPGNGVCYVTWHRVGVYNQTTLGGTVVHSMQCVLHEDGEVEFRYGSMPTFLAPTTFVTDPLLAGVCGFSRGAIAGAPSADPQSRDLSLELPFVTSVEGGLGNLGLQVAAAPVAAGGAYGGRAFAGQSLTWNVDNVPLGTVVGVQLLDFASSRPGLVLPSITAPGCVLSVSTGAVLWDVQVWPAGAVSGAVPLAIPPGFDGLEVYAQYVVLGGLFGGADLISAASNAVRQVVGRR